MVRNPGADPLKYHLALRQAEAAGRLTSPQAEYYRVYLSTLGKGQYRVGLYREAVESLERANSLYSTDDVFKGGPPANFGFLAMAYHRLGQKEKAQAALDRLRQFVKSRGW